MKDYINLLPPEYFPKSDSWRWSVTAVVILLGGSILIYGVFMHRVGGAQNEVRNLQGKLDMLQNEWTVRVRETTPKEEDRQHVGIADTDLRKGDQVPWAFALREISLIVPEGLSLSLMETFQPSQGMAIDPAKYQGIRIQGQAFSYQQIMDFIRRLDTSRSFKIPSLGFAQADEVSDETGSVRRDGRIRFEIIAAVRKGTS